MWMTPFYLFFGVLIVYIFRFQINLNKLKNFVLAFLILFMLSPFTYAYISITQTDKRTDYPGGDIAAKIQTEWDKTFPEKKILSVHGDEWLAGNLSYHLKKRPTWYYYSWKSSPRVKIYADDDTFMIFSYKEKPHHQFNRIY